MSCDKTEHQSPGIKFAKVFISDINHWYKLIRFSIDLVY